MNRKSTAPSRRAMYPSRLMPRPRTTFRMDVVVDGHLIMRQEKYREASLFLVVILTLSEVECRRTPVFLFSPLLFFNPSHPCKSVVSLHTRYHKISPVSR